MPVNIFSRVDFPLPDGPVMANRLWAGIEKVRSSRMTVFRFPVPITRERCSTWISEGGPAIKRRVASAWDGCIQLLLRYFFLFDHKRFVCFKSSVQPGDHTSSILPAGFFMVKSTFSLEPEAAILHMT